jgi:hypothetical protein
MKLMHSQWQSAPDSNWIDNGHGLVGIFYQKKLTRWGNNESVFAHIALPASQYSICGELWVANKLVDLILQYNCVDDIKNTIVDLRNKNEVNLCMDCYEVLTNIQIGMNIAREAIDEHAILWRNSRTDERGPLVRFVGSVDGRTSLEVRKDEVMAGSQVYNSKAYRFGYFAEAKRGRK